jgi:Asp-tRNA(Asn)/Glu-tRNA(Gln) amidotransferase A subunit family amidase
MRCRQACWLDPEGEVSAAEVLKAAIERLEEINPRLNAVNYKARASPARVSTTPEAAGERE